MKVYITKSFDREARRDGISDADCKEAVQKAENGLLDADLGGGLIKQRISRGNRSASKGSRAIVFYKRGNMAVFLHVFPKSKKASLSRSELVQYHKAAQVLEKLTQAQLLALCDDKGWRELQL
jgi:hypothetical protein